MINILQSSILLIIIIFFNSTAQAISSNHQKNISFNSYLAWQHLPKFKQVDSVTGVPLNASGEVGLPSNANNFHGSANATVDPRTGNAQFAIVVGNLLYDEGRSTHNLVLFWHGSSSDKGIDSLGLGSLWSFNIGLERPSTSLISGHFTTDIVTGDGHSFTMESTHDKHGNTIWKPLRHKLKDVVITGRPGNWTITMINGNREHLSNGYEDWEEDRSGKRLWFYYDHNGTADITRHLLYICGSPLTLTQVMQAGNACPNNGIRLTYSGDNITVHGLQNIVLNTFNNHGVTAIKSVAMPSFSSTGTGYENNNAHFYFTYDEQGERPWLLHSVTEPSGLVTTFAYNNESSRQTLHPHGLQAGLNSYLPVVTEQTVTYPPSIANLIPVKHIWYRYSGGPEHLHNYTGYLNGQSINPGKDNLLDRPDNYTYTVSMDNGFATTMTTYNKYHLALTTKMIDDHNFAKIAINNSDYSTWQRTVFAQLPPTYSLPKKTDKVLYSLTEIGNDSQIQVKNVSQQKRYDQMGRVIWQQDATGRQVFWQYCPATGDAHCPIDNPNWPENLIEKMLILPANNQHNSADTNSVIEKTFDYIRIPISTAKQKNNQLLLAVNSLSGARHVSQQSIAMLPLSISSTLKIGEKLPDPLDTQRLEQLHYHYNLQTNSDNYGELTGIVLDKFAHNSANHLAFTVENIRNLANQTITYIVNLATLKKTNSQSILLNRANSLSGISIYSLQTGVQLLKKDVLSNLKTTWQYDNWNRPIKETVTPLTGGTPKIMTWSYIDNGDFQSVIQTFANGNQQKIDYFANGKHSLIFAISHHYPHLSWFKDTKISYAANDKPKMVIDYHQTDNGKIIGLVTKYGYDDLNRLVWTEHPNGIIDIQVRNDPQNLLINYQVLTGSWQTIPASQQQLSAKIAPLITVTKANMFGKPVARYVFATDDYLKQQLKPVKSLTTLHNYGMLTLSGKNGLLTWINKAINTKAWLNLTTYIYDGSGQLISQTQPNGNQTHWVWNAGELVKTITPTGSIIHDTHDIHDDITSRCVQIPGSQICHQLGVRKYNDEGHLLYQIDELGNRITYTYDQDMRLHSVTYPPSSKDSASHTLTYHYNSYAVTQIDLDGIPYVKKYYDPQTWQLTDREDAIYHIHYDYDPNTSLLVKITYSSPKKFTSPVGINYPTGFETMQYNSYQALIKHTDVLGNTYQVQHNILGKIYQSQVTMPNKKTIILKKIKWDQYYNRPTQITNGLGLTRSFAYNLFGNVINANDVLHGNLFMSQHYKYDIKTHDLITWTRIQGDRNATENFTYDKHNNLQQMSCHAFKTNKIGSLCPRDTDLTGSSLSKPPIIINQQYQFNGWNNISMVTEKLAVNQQIITKITRYSYAGVNQAVNGHYDPHRLIALSNSWQNAGYSISPQVIHYDQLGRIVQDGTGNLLHYDAQGHMDRFSNQQTGEVTHYFYDSYGLQIAKQPFNSHGKALQKPLYIKYRARGSGLEPFIQWQNSHVSINFSHIAGSEDGIIKHWYLHDYKGDVLTSLNAQGKPEHDMVYSPYGMNYDLLINPEDQALKAKLHIAKQQPWWQNIPGFDGQITDMATGYQFLGGGYRAYNPIYRHFMQHDESSPFTKIDGYGFGDNNPIMEDDPNGHNPAWLGYMFGGFAVLASVLSAVLLPIVAASVAVGIGASIAGAIGASAAAGAMVSGIGAASGVLQILGTAYPHSTNLQKANSIMEIINGVTMAMTTGLTLSLGAVDFDFNICAGLGALVPSVFEAGSSITQLAGGSVDTAISFNHNLIYNPGLKNLANNLQIAGLVLMGLTMAADALGSLVVSIATVHYYRKRIVSEIEGEQPHYEPETTVSSQEQLYYEFVNTDQTPEIDQESLGSSLISDIGFSVNSLDSTQKLNYMSDMEFDSYFYDFISKGQIDKLPIDEFEALLKDSRREFIISILITNKNKRNKSFIEQNFSKIVASIFDDNPSTMLDSPERNSALIDLKKLSPERKEAIKQEINENNYMDRLNQREQMILCRSIGI